MVSEQNPEIQAFRDSLALLDPGLTLYIEFNREKSDRVPNGLRVNIVPW